MRGWSAAMVPLLALACASRQQIIAIDCGLEPRGTPGLEVRPARTARPTPSQSTTGSLRFLVRLGVPDGAPIAGATLTLHHDTLARDRNAPLRVGHTDTAGRVSWDSLPAGPYGLLVRALGYGVLERRIEVRPGGRDTVEVRLRAIPVC